MDKAEDCHPAGIRERLCLEAPYPYFDAARGIEMYPKFLSLLFLVFLCGRIQCEVSVLTQLRNIPAYANLPGCQALCIGGSLRVDPATTSYSAGYSTSCKTKDCFCSAGQRTWLNTFIWDCMQNSPTSCRATGFENNYNGAMTFLGDWCGFTPVLRV